MKSTHFSCPVLIKLQFSQQILKNPHTSNFRKIHPAGAKLFHADRHDEANSHFAQFCECT
jgi:hypothetical protein